MHGLVKVSTRLNPDVFFSSNIHGSLKASIKSSLNIRELDWDSKYLGNYLFPRSRKKEEFEHIKRKICNCLEGWRAKLLLQAGRNTLVKHVITAIPLYCMAAEKVPTTTYKEIEKRSRAFLWRRNGNNSRGWNPVAWKKICKPKGCGGLGMRSLKAMNSTMLGKIGWSLMNDRDKMWVKVLKSKYFPSSSFVQCRKKKNCSQLWSAVLNTRKILKQGLCFKVGRGNNINYWKDPWLPDLSGFKPIPRIENMVLRQGMVNQLKNSNGT